MNKFEQAIFEKILADLVNKLVTRFEDVEKDIADLKARLDRIPHVSLQQRLREKRK